MPKVKIQEKEGIPLRDQRVFYSTKQLKDGARLQEYNIQSQATLHLEGRRLSGDYWTIVEVESGVTEKTVSSYIEENKYCTRWRKWARFEDDSRMGSAHMRRSGRRRNKPLYPSKTNLPKTSWPYQFAMRNCWSTSSHWESLYCPIVICVTFLGKIWFDASRRGHDFNNNTLLSW